MRIVPPWIAWFYIRDTRERNLSIVLMYTYIGILVTWWIVIILVAEGVEQLRCPKVLRLIVLQQVQIVIGPLSRKSRNLQSSTLRG